MQAITAFWHLANFFAPAVAIGCIASALAKLMWRRDLAATRWLRLSAWSSLAMAAVLLAGLVVFGHDGKMATYAVMVVVCASVLWWLGRPDAGR